MMDQAAVDTADTADTADMVDTVALAADMAEWAADTGVDMAGDTVDTVVGRAASRNTNLSESVNQPHSSDTAFQSCRSEHLPFGYE